ncbi:MAG: hypothetical protein WCP11_01885 [Candidatus Saccharibacteria bacterium]
MSNPDDANYPVRVNVGWLKNEIGAEAYEKAVEIPDDATFQLGSVISKFIRGLKAK